MVDAPPSRVSEIHSSYLTVSGSAWFVHTTYIHQQARKSTSGLISEATVGFMSPDPDATVNPSYHQVCSGSTGHVKVLYVELNKPDEDFEHFIRFFFQFHDPITKNRQGNDAGTQYASVIFCEDDKQKDIAAKVISDLRGLVDDGKIKYLQEEIHTPIIGMNPFYPADEQAYLENNPNGYRNHHYCFREWPQLI